MYLCAKIPVIGTPFTAASLLLWAFIAAVNLCVAVPICVRFCIAQRKMHKFLSPSPYKSVAIIFVECGTLITVCSVALLILYARSYQIALVCLGIATQVTVHLYLSFIFLSRVDRSMHRLRLNCSSPHDMPC